MTEGPLVHHWVDDLKKVLQGREIGEALLDQQVIAGIGNILRIAILFGSRLHPRRHGGSLSKKDRTSPMDTETI